jgi:hypothetical protein
MNYHKQEAAKFLYIYVREHGYMQILKIETGLGHMYACLCTYM